ncbi:MAG: L-threonylcarbamoyladenylate synthase [Betaproteobacteria bacterium]|nr:L-threonylcarbamoyladenylate synthase [Betaproteobacteria bacterium]
MNLQDAIHGAANLLRAGDTVAFPTETVYGLGADAANPLALRKVFEAKGRPSDHPLIVHIADSSHLSGWAQDVPDMAWKLADAFWPGPLTLILLRHDQVLNAVTGGQDTVGLRVPDHPVALALLRAFGGGIAAPSANRFGRVSPTSAQHVREELGTKVGMILDGGSCRVGVESTIISLVHDKPVLLRPGSLCIAYIEDTLHQKLMLTQVTEQIIRAPGALPAHYAPTTPLELHFADALLHRARRLSAQGCKVVVLGLGEMSSYDISNNGFEYFSMPELAKEYARVLYATLRHFDRAGFDVLLAEDPPDTQPWLAVKDRLRRGAQGC